MSVRDFDQEAIVKRLARSIGNGLAEVLPAWVGDGEGNTSAEDETDVPNTFYIRFDPDSNERTYAYADVTQNTGLYFDGLAVKVTAYYQRRPGDKVDWVIVGSDEKMAGIQFGAQPPDPAAGFGDIKAHTHQSATQGGQLDASFIFNGGQVSAEFGGTNNDLIANPPDDGQMFIWNAANQRLEPVSFAFGGLLEGRDGGTPVPLTPVEPNDTIRSYFDTVDRWKRVRNNLTATTNPTVNDDSGDGYDIASFWYNETTEVLYFCADPTLTAAVWKVWTLDLNKISVDTVDPTVNDDIDDGYGVNSLWFNTTDETVFACFDASSGAAVWTQIGGGGGVLNNFTSNVNPTTSDDDTLGYSAGSLWYNNVDLTLWLCFDASTGTAAWNNIWGYASTPTLAVNTATGATYTADVTNYFIKVDATSNNVTVELPPAASVFGRQYVIKRIDNSGNTVTIDPDGTETIDGATTYTLPAQYDSATIISDGTEWWII